MVQNRFGEISVGIEGTKNGRKARLDQQQNQLEQVLAGFMAQPMPLAAPTAVQRPVKPPTAYHIPKLAAQPASMQTIQPAVSKVVLAVQVAPRDPGIDGSIPGMYTTEEVKKFRAEGRTDNQIKILGRRKIARRANRAKRRDGE
uniref:Uncharacterized protein n=1 Tax=Romanomermis culicivorax TaxID=13658 RepID=A0A915IJP7_ROMCU